MANFRAVPTLAHSPTFTPRCSRACRCRRATAPRAKHCLLPQRRRCARGRSDCLAVLTSGRTPRRASVVPQQLAVSETIDKVIVHHPDRLHVGVDDGGADEAESAFLQILAERVRLG